VRRLLYTASGFSVRVKWKVRVPHVVDSEEGKIRFGNDIGVSSAGPRACPEEGGVSSMGDGRRAMSAVLGGRKVGERDE